jgi:isoquinoline 1-oxidoreductase alpha subunit
MADPDDRSSTEPGAGQSNGTRIGVAAGVTSAGVVVAAAAIVAANQVASSQGTPPAIPDGSILVNGQTHMVESAPGTPLLYVLRDELGITSPKFGCGLAQCGACAVLVGSKETRACVTAWDTVKDEITTVEGLPARWAKQASGAGTAAAADALHPVQQAWIDEQVPQCGYCQSGMMIMAVDLLSRVSNPSERQIRDAFTSTPPSPHLCRCGTYQSIIAAVRRAAGKIA